MPFKERYDKCHKIFRDMDLGIMNILLYVYVPIICCSYAIVTSFEFLVFFLLLLVYYV